MNSEVYQEKEEAKEPLCLERKKAVGRCSLGELDELNVQETCPNAIPGFQMDGHIDSGSFQFL